MTIRPSIDEIVAKRRSSANADGELFKAIILDDSEAKKYDRDERAQRFIMSTETVDLYGDIVRQDGINTENFLKNPVALAYHNHTAPIGWWKDVTRIKGRPKRTEGVLTLHAAGTTAAVDEIDNLLAASAIKACSIGFKPLDAEWILDAEGRNTYGLDFVESILLECSVCSIPANPGSLAKAAGGDMRLAAELFEKVLDTYCEKTSGGLFVRKEFSDAYMAMKASKTTVTAPKKDGSAMSTLKVEFDFEEAERQAESFLEKLSKRVADIFRAPTEQLQAPADDKAEYRDAAPVFMKDADGKISLKGKWPQKFAIIPEILRDADEIIDRDGHGVTIRCANSVAELSVDDEDDDFLYVSLVRSYDPPPALIAGSRAKAVAARERMKQSLRDRGVLT